MDLNAWPLFGLSLRCRGLRLRAVTEADLPHLTAVLPADYGLDPRAERFAGLDPAPDRARLLAQDYWRSLGTWSPSSWCLNLAVEHDGAVVGMQALEGDDFPVLRTVDSHSWLVEPVRGRGLGVAMRLAVLALAFDHLGAVAAVSSAEPGNGPSLGVSRRLGYTPNGVSLTDSGHGPIPLAHLRLTAEDWRASGAGQQVTVTGFAPCRPWFGFIAPPGNW